MNHLLIIAGPTATGKTKLGLKLAQKFDGEILSADSRQVFQGMDIGSGKDLPPNLKPQTSALKAMDTQITFYNHNHIKLWGYNLVRPDQEFSLAHFQRFASVIVPHLHSRNKLPIIVGGTGLYLKSFSHHLSTTHIPPNIKLRAKLDQYSTSQLQSQLKNINPSKYNSMNHSDQNNPRRLIRAIEISLSPTPSTNATSFSQYPHQLWIGLKAPLTTLDQQVKQNIITRSRQLTSEIHRLENLYPQFWHTPAASALGYRQWHQFLTGRITQRKALGNWITAETQYLRRQLTWFKQQSQIHWFDISTPDWQPQVDRLVEDWYSKDIQPQKS